MNKYLYITSKFPYQLIIAISHMTLWDDVGCGSGAVDDGVSSGGGGSVGCDGVMRMG